MYHIVVMHSQCTLACPTLLFWSCIQVYGLGLRKQTRGFKEEARDQKNKKTKSGRVGETFWFRLDVWFFCFTLFFGFGVEKLKKHVIFLVFAVSRSLNRARTLAVFVFFIQKPKNTCFFCFSARRHHESQKNTCAFWFFDPKTKNKQCQTKKIKNPAETKRLSSRFDTFGFGLFLLSRKIVGSRFPKQMAVCVSVLIEKQSFLEPQNVPKHS